MFLDHTVRVLCALVGLFLLSGVPTAVMHSRTRSSKVLRRRSFHVMLQHGDKLVNIADEFVMLDETICGEPVLLRNFIVFFP